MRPKAYLERLMFVLISFNAIYEKGKNGRFIVVIMKAFCIDERKSSKKRKTETQEKKNQRQTGK